RTIAAFVLGLVACLVIGIKIPAQQGARGGEWSHHNGDKGRTKDLPPHPITRKNSRKFGNPGGRPAPPREILKRPADLVVPGLFRSTPLMINGVLYASNGIGLVEAFDPATGKTLWIQEPPESTPEALTGSSTRSIGYWRNGAEERILSVRPPYLVAINPKTGELVQSFGSGGKVDLRLDLGAQPAPFNGTSAPLVIKDVVVVGSSIADNPNFKEGAPGDIRGYDVRTGKLRWKFRVIPREGELGVETWENRSWEYTGAVNAWTNLSADEELGYIYLPL